MKITFETPDGARTRAHPEEAKRSDDGKAFVWIRTQSGEITRAFATGEVE
jgi:hypothetical protein